MTQARSSSTGTKGVTGYWLVNVNSGPHAGHSAVIWTSGTSPFSTPNLSTAVLQALGASSSGQIGSYYMGGDPKNLQSEFDRALGQLNLSIDQTPVFPSSGTPQQILGGGLLKPLNFDVLSPLGVSPSQEFQKTQPIGKAVTGFLDGLSDWQKLAVRALEALAGFALILLGLQAMTGTGGQGYPIRTVKRYAR
jgi:hypothetical protein